MDKRKYRLSITAPSAYLIFSALTLTSCDYFGYKVVNPFISPSAQVEQNYTPGPRRMPRDNHVYLDEMRKSNAASTYGEEDNSQPRQFSHGGGGRVLPDNEVRFGEEIASTETPREEKKGFFSFLKFPSLSSAKEKEQTLQREETRRRVERDMVKMQLESQQHAQPMPAPIPRERLPYSSPMVDAQQPTPVHSHEEVASSAPSAPAPSHVVSPTKKASAKQHTPMKKATKPVAKRTLPPTAKPAQPASLAIEAPVPVTEPHPAPSAPAVTTEPISKGPISIPVDQMLKQTEEMGTTQEEGYKPPKLITPSRYSKE